MRPFFYSFLEFNLKAKILFNMKKYEKLQDIIEPAVTSIGYDFVGIEYHRNSVNSLLRVFIDKDGGVNLDDCMAVNSQVSGVLDVSDPIAGKYSLEISSPGLDRPLFSIQDFFKFKGSEVKLRVSQPINKQRNFKGIIDNTDIEKETIELKLENETLIEIKFSQIDVAKLVPKYFEKGDDK